MARAEPTPDRGARRCDDLRSLVAGLRSLGLSAQDPTDRAIATEAADLLESLDAERAAAIQSLELIARDSARWEDRLLARIESLKRKGA